MSKHIVLITSAIYSNYGIYTPEQRAQQTLDTVLSAKKYLPDATLVLVDNSKVDIQNDNSDVFNEILDTVDYYIDNSDDSDIQYFHNHVQNYDIGKNSMEALGIAKALTHMKNDPELSELIKNSSRIFKLSGRYVLTDKFDIKQHDNKNTKRKYVFKKRQPSWIPQADTGVDHLLQTRLYSFSTDLFDDTLALFAVLIQNMFDTFNRQKYIDVEHSMAKFIPKEYLVELDTVGLQGNIAPNGMMIID